MRSSAPGKSASNAEVQDISKNGLWLLVQGKEYFLPFDGFPWFKDAKLSAIYNLRLIHGTHLHWPDLDVDLEIDNLKNPDDYPLIYRA